MSTSARRGISAALSARLDTRGTKAVLEFQEMKRRMVLMTWITNLTMRKAMSKVHSGSCRAKEMMLIFLHHLGMNHIIGFHASQVGIRFLEIFLMLLLTVILSVAPHQAMLIQAFLYL
jgi:hypothetical protein